MFISDCSLGPQSDQIKIIKGNVSKASTCSYTETRIVSSTVSSSSKSEMMGPFTGPLLSVRAKPEEEISPVGSSSSQTMTDLMPVIFPLILPARLTELSPVKPLSSEPIFDPLESQPVSDRERNKRRPGSSKKPTQNPPEASSD